MSILLEMPMLKGKTKSGKMIYWKGNVVEDLERNIIMTSVSFGYSLDNLQTTFTEYIQGKNIGKMNETTPLEQATKELKRKWKDKKDKSGYIDMNKEIPVEDTSTTMYPMLCSSYKVWKEEYSGYMVQPKLDGIRCLIKIKNKEITFQSRNGNLFILNHLVDELTKIHKIIGKDIILDGELYSNEIPFEELVGHIRKSSSNSTELNEDVKKIKFHCFDIVKENNFEERYTYLKNLFHTKDKYSNIHLVETEYINNEDELISFYDRMMNKKYEGIILRNPKGKYICKYRSKDVMKFKQMKESEYKIVGYEQGIGKDKGTMIWICEVPNTMQTFKVRPRGSHSYRKELYENGDKYIGKQLTIIYQELTKNNIPRFPVGKCVRNGE